MLSTLPDLVEAVTNGQTGEADWANSVQALTNALRTYAQEITPLTAFKPSDEAVISSTTYQDDDHLAVTVAANARYAFRADLLYTGLNTGDLKIQWTGPASCSFYWHTIAVSTTDTSTSSVIGVNLDLGYTLTTSSPYGAKAIGALNTGGGTPIGLAAVVEGTLVTGVNGGSWQLQWAQNASTGVAATTMKAGSSMTLLRVA